MAALILLLLDTWPVVYGQGLLEDLHSYDVLRYEVKAEPAARGLKVDCRLTLKVTRSGPVRLLLSRDVEGLVVERDGALVAAELGTGGFERIVRMVARDVAGIPSLFKMGSA